jgi:hypothetical protein
MSLPITFHRAASAEFIEASVWYESKRLGLALKFMAEIDRCVSLAAEHPLQFAVVREDIRRVVANIAFHTAFIFVRRNIALLSWRYFMAAEILQFCWLESNSVLSSRSRVNLRHFAAIKHF